MLVVGRTLQHPVLVTIDPVSGVPSTQVLEDSEAPQNFFGIQRSPDETVLVTGTNVSPGGVGPVAFVAPWPD